MSEFKNKRKHNFTMIGNAALLDLSLSLKAKGLLSIMLIYPDRGMDWMEKQSKDGRDATQAAMKELIEHGYVTRKVKQNPETKQLEGWDYTVTGES